MLPLAAAACRDRDNSCAAPAVCRLTCLAVPPPVPPPCCSGGGVHACARCFACFCVRLFLTVLPCSVRSPHPAVVEACREEPDALAIFRPAVLCCYLRALGEKAPHNKLEIAVRRVKEVWARQAQQAQQDQPSQAVKLEQVSASD